MKVRTTFIFILLRVRTTFLFILLRLHYQTETSLSAKGHLKNKKTVRSFILKAWTVFICTRLRLRSQAILHLWMFSGIQRTPNVATLFSGYLKYCAWSCCCHRATGCGWHSRGQSVRYVRRWAFGFPKGYSGNSRWLIALNFANGQACRQTDFYQHGTSLSTG